MYRKWRHLGAERLGLQDEARGGLEVRALVGAARELQRGRLHRVARARALLRGLRLGLAALLGARPEHRAGGDLAVRVAHAVRQRGAHCRRRRPHAANARADAGDGAGAVARRCGARDAVTGGRVPEARHTRTCEPHEHRDARHAAGTHARFRAKGGERRNELNSKSRENCLEVSGQKTE